MKTPTIVIVASWVTVVGTIASIGLLLMQLNRRA